MQYNNGNHHIVTLRLHQPLGGGAENAGVEKSGVDSMGGKCRSDNGWKAVRKEKYKTT